MHIAKEVQTFKPPVMMRGFQFLIGRYFGEESFVWFNRAYIADWLVITGLWVLSQVISWSPVYERDFDPSDHLISLSHQRNQISGSVNHFVALLIPIAIFAIVGTFQGSLHTVHHAAIGLWGSRGLARFITLVLKHSIGRLRPDFLSRCKWDSALGSCTGAAKYILEGRKSFPSGHSSTAFSCMVFLSLWIAGQTGAWCFTTSPAYLSIRSSRMVVFSLTLLPIFWAMHVAITRIQDHRHHKEDVIVGSLIGVASALVFYFMFWPNPFSSSSFEFSTRGQPRLLYSQELSYSPPRVVEDYELNQTELGEFNV